MANSILTTLGLLFLNDSFAMTISSWKNSSSLPNDPKRPQVTVRGWGEVVFDESPIPTELNSLKRWMKVQEKRSIYVVCGVPLPATVTTRIIIITFLLGKSICFIQRFEKKTAEKTEMKLRIFGRTFCPYQSSPQKKWSEGSCPRCDFFHQKNLLESFTIGILRVWNN